MKTVNFTKFSTKELVGAWNAYKNFLHEKPIKKFADRKTAEKRLNELLSSANSSYIYNGIVKSESLSLEIRSFISAKFLAPKDKEKRTDGKYQRKNPVFETESERKLYVSSRYATKSRDNKFPGRKSQFQGCTFTIKDDINCPFREGTVVENSFNLINNNPYISYEDFRINGGRNTDLKAMVDKGIVCVIRWKASA